MPLTFGYQGEGFTPARRVPISAAELEDTLRRLRADKIFGDQGTIPLALNQGERKENLEWRIDRQSPPSNGLTVNLQIQKNWEPRPSTVACALVPWVLQKHNPGGAGPAFDQYARWQAEFIAAVRGALRMSASSHRPGEGNPRRGMIKVCIVSGNYA